MKSINRTYEVEATPVEVFAALTDPDLIQKWSGGPARMSSQVGAEFSLFGGSIHGVNLEVVPGEKLIQEWYAENWQNPSKVTFTLAESAGGTTVALSHEGVPDGDVAKISEGWDKYYLDQIQKMFQGGVQG